MNNYRGWTLFYDLDDSGNDTLSASKSGYQNGKHFRHAVGPFYESEEVYQAIDEFEDGQNMQRKSNPTAGRLTAAEKKARLAEALRQLSEYHRLQKLWSKVFNERFEANNGRKAGIGDANVSGIGSASLDYESKGQLRAINAKINAAMDSALSNYKASGKRNFIPWKEAQLLALENGGSAKKVKKERKPKGLTKLKGNAHADKRAGEKDEEVSQDPRGVLKWHTINAGTGYERKIPYREKNPAATVDSTNPFTRSTKGYVLKAKHNNGDVFYWSGDTWVPSARAARRMSNMMAARDLASALGAHMPASCELHILDVGREKNPRGIPKKSDPAKVREAGEYVRALKGTVPVKKKRGNNPAADYYLRYIPADQSRGRNVSHVRNHLELLDVINENVSDIRENPADWYVDGPNGVTAVIDFLNRLTISGKQRHYAGEIYSRIFGDKFGDLRDMRKRATNPATVATRNKGIERVVLLLKGHAMGNAWWTGEVWDTDRKKARVITGAVLADVVKLAQKLAKGMPDKYRIEVHPAKK